MMKSYLHTFYKVAFIMLYFWSQLGFAQNRQLATEKYVKGELILKYEPISRKEAAGQYILEEHRLIEEILFQNFRLFIDDVKPVHSSLVSKMIKKKATEKSILRGISRNKTRNQDLSDYNFSRKLLLRFNSDLDISTLIEQIKANTTIFSRAGYRIISISPNYLFEKQATPNDPLYRFQWAHPITQAEKAWEITKGNSDVVIAIIDTGIDDLNPDMADKLVAAYDFVDVNLSAYEQWQRVDNEDYVNQDDDPTDTDGHGTHVAGIAAARGFDDFGITGVCPDCSIMPLRAGAQFYRLDEENEEDTVLTSLFNSANVSDALFHAVENGADVINMSFGGEGRTGYQDVLQFANTSGVVLIAAAGNDDKEDAFYPAFYPEVLAVASTNTEDEKSDFSNFGSWVDVSAPGSAILSTYPEDLGASVSESLLSVDGEEFETTIFTFSGYTSENGLSGDLVYVGLARQEDLDDSNFKWDELSGNIAFIQRGEITFREKVDRVKSRGAIGAIIFNHQEGPIFGTLGEARDNPVPVLGLTKKDGESILSKLNSQTAKATLTVDLLSEMHTFNSGTSMASPYVAGMAGLLLSEEPDLSPDEVKTRIKASVDLIDSNNPTYIGQLGTGRVNLSTLFESVAPPSTESRFKLYPNPSSGTFRIDLFLEERGEVRIRVFNLIGSLVQEQSFNKQSDFWNANMDIGAFPPGIYLVQVTHGSLKETKKLILSE